MKELSASDLRIGNYYNSAKFNRTVRCEMADFSEIYQRAEGATPDESDINMIFEPILLTENWLLKFGFAIDQDFYNTQVKLWQSNSGFNYLALNKNDDGYETCLGYHHPQIEKIRILINECLKYVHQLQNLYMALTGKELEIKKFL